MNAFDAWVERFTAHVRAKGRVPPGKYRAFGYTPPGHRFADLKLKWRDLRMRAGHPPQGSSPQIQQDLGLNKDATWKPGRSEQARQGKQAP